ncbi:uncharacterized protein LOC133137663 [Conger conger]|uniref:uncharacterized protein LOC133137663 n=1 Tax=Conger conger TaxID=82655 RepID=UPI002A59E7A7|nr:uncharacterized protein LOC133137663 [Conger conger]
MDARSPATFSMVEEHGDRGPTSPPRPVSCLEKCGACGTKLVPDRSPQLLPCLHSLCQQCVRVDRRECPVCAAEYSLTEVIDDLFFKQSQQSTQCGGCWEAEVGGWCVECGEALCPECISAHKRVKMTREHTILSERPATVSVPTVYCSTHKEERVELVCQTCDQPTCRECQLLFHRNHRFQFLHEAAAEERDRIRSLMDDLRLKKRAVRTSLSDLDTRLLDLKDLQNTLNDELKDTVLGIRHALLKQATSLSLEVQNLCGLEKKNILERQEVLKKLEERQTYLLTFTDRALDTEGFLAPSSYTQKIQSQLHDVMSQDVSPGDAMMNLTFHCAQDTYSQMAAFGKIVTETVPFACTNNENAIHNKNQSFSTAKTPSTSSLMPLTDIDNSLASSHSPAASSLNLPSASSQTSTTLNADPYTHNLTQLSSHSTPTPTFGSPQIQTAFSYISTTSSSIPPTSSSIPPTSSCNPPISSSIPPSSSPPTSFSSPPTSSCNPPTSSSIPPTSSCNPPISSSIPPTSSSSPPTSFSSPPTSSCNPPISSSIPPTSSSSHPTSSSCPPTSSSCPPTSSSSYNSPVLFQRLCPSSFTTLTTPAVSLTQVSPNTSSQQLILLYLLSSLPVITVPLSLPVTLYSVPVNSVPVVTNPLMPNGKAKNPDSPAVQTAANSPCSQTLPTASQAVILSNAQGLRECLVLDPVAGLASPTKDQTPRGICLTSPVRALADSPCESAPPAGHEQEQCEDPTAAENEPTSTVAEADSRESTGDPGEEATPKPDATLAGGITAPKAIDDSPVDGLSVSSLHSAGVDLQMLACCPGDTGSEPQNPAQVVCLDQSDLFLCPVEEDYDELDAADVGNNQEPRTSNRRPAPMSHFKKLPDFVCQWVPPSWKKKCRKKRAKPFAVNTVRNSTVAKMDRRKTCEVSIAEVGKTDCKNVENSEVDGRVNDYRELDDCGEVDSAEETDYNEETDDSTQISYADDSDGSDDIEESGSWETNESQKTEDFDTESVQKPREENKSHSVPKISLVRLPVSFPLPGGPLPQFRLTLGTNGQEVHLEQIPEEGQSSFAKCSSEKLGRIRWSLERKRKDLPLDCTSSPVMSKRAKSISVQGTTEEHLWKISEEIREECKQTSPDEDRIKHILKETFKTRRAWIDLQPPSKILPICKPYPCFRLGTFIMSEFAMLLGESKFDAIPQRADNFLSIMESMMGKQKEGELRMLPVLSMIEENTKFERGNSESVITVCKDASLDDAQLESRETDPPRLVLHVTDGRLLDSFIVGDAMTARAQANTVLEAVITLLGTYYTFHLQYPRIYSQALGFLQQRMLGDTYMGPKSNGFKSLSKQFIKYKKKAMGYPNENSSMFATSA